MEKFQYYVLNFLIIDIKVIFQRRNKQCLHTNSATAKAMSITDNSRAVMQLVNTPIKQDYALKAESDSMRNKEE